jgi:hypothetical protein
MQNTGDGQLPKQATLVICLLQGAYFRETCEWPVLARRPEESQSDLEGMTRNSAHASGLLPSAGIKGIKPFS